ncbi:MAG: hypothetical protein WKF75_01165 [Singulisphaera sp.]
MVAERALRLGLGRCPGWAGRRRGGFSIEQIRDRLRSRYPEAEPLPPPDLDALLHRVGLDVRWDDEKTIYRRRDATVPATWIVHPHRRTTAPRPARSRSPQTWPRPASSRSRRATPTATAGSWC